MGPKGRHVWQERLGARAAFLPPVCPGLPPALVQLGKTAQELWGYLETNRDSLPNYGKRYRAAFTDSAVNEVVAKPINKSQQMRWNRYTARALPDSTPLCAQWHPRRGRPHPASFLPPNDEPSGSATDEPSILAERLQRFYQPF
jgi:hypothetical protein